MLRIKCKNMGKNYKVAILGAGPGGYVAAIRAAQFGLATCLIEKDKLGGVCLNQGCIPTKALIRNVHILDCIKDAAHLGLKIENPIFDFSLCQQKKEHVVERLRKGIEFILKKYRVDIFYGTGNFIDAKNIAVGQETISFENCIIAVGSRPRGLDSIKFDKQNGILSSNDILELKVIPQSLLIIGGGVIGCEFAYIFNRLGSEVTIVELLPQILATEDEEISRQLATDFKKRQIKIITKSQVKEINKNSQGMWEAVLDSGQKVAAENVLISVGRVSNLDLQQAVALGIKQEKGYLLTNERMQTNISNFYAIGDVVGKSFLAHVASSEAKVAIENIAGKDEGMNYDYIPRCVYTNPQIASVGITEKQAKDKGQGIKIGKFPFLGSGKAVIEQETPGFVKIIVDAKNDLILGAHIYGAMATELISEICVAMEAGMTYKKFAKVIRPHPTLSEAVMEAAEDIDGFAIHTA